MYVEREYFMNRENRKVLISVKVSTLLLILIAIIGIVVLVNVIKNNILPKQEVAIENNEKISEEIINTEGISMVVNLFTYSAISSR